MSIINGQTTGYPKNDKAYQLPIALHLLYRIEIKTEKLTICPAYYTSINKKTQIIFLKTGKR
jgi:hypothetical protein